MLLAMGSVFVNKQHCSGQGNRNCVHEDVCWPDRAVVMGQRDPNNVSGLLKLHLREHPLLSQETCGAIKAVLESGNSVSPHRGIGCLYWGGGSGRGHIPCSY